jgi:hypothetical protein
MQYRKSWESFKRKRRLTLCYNCRKSRHLAKECPGKRPICVFYKAMDHEVLDCPRMIANFEEMNMRQEKPKTNLENEIKAEPHK